MDAINIKKSHIAIYGGMSCRPALFNRLTKHFRDIRNYYISECVNIKIEELMYIKYWEIFNGKTKK